MYFWIGFLVFKFIYVSLTPMTLDENYYWVWSQNLSLSYFDHPPMVAWIFKMGDFLPSWMLKWPAVVLGHTTLFIWDQMLKRWGWSDDQRQRTLYLAMMAPLIGMSGMIVTPDLPLLFFQVLSLYCFDRALDRGRSLDYILFGFLLGLAFTSKYLIVLMVPCLIFYLFFSKQWNRVRWTKVLLIFIFGLIGSAPVLIWNYQHEWSSFGFQLDHGVGKKNWNPVWPWEYLASLFFLILPIYFKSIFIALRENKQKLLISLSLPLLVFLFLVCFRSKVEANWSQLAFLPLLSLMGFYDESRKKAQMTLIVWSVLAMALSWVLRTPWSPGCPEKICETQRYKNLLPYTEKYEGLMASNYQMASFIWFQTKKPMYKLYHSNRVDFFDSFVEAKPIGPVFYLAKLQEGRFPRWILEQNSSIEKIESVDQELEIFKIEVPPRAHYD